MGSEWTRTTDRLPSKSGDDDHVDCLIVLRGQVLLRPWNCHHECWDDAEGDDYFCDPTEPTYWMPLPAPPPPGELT